MGISTCFGCNCSCLIIYKPLFKQFLVGVSCKFLVKPFLREVHEAIDPSTS
ncbi:hypothetical protein V6Z11_D05G410800 [Gossypium hirsutum]